MTKDLIGCILRAAALAWWGRDSRR